MTEKLRGVYSALATPFAAGTEEIDEIALRRLVSATIDGGVHGIVPLGSTGEFSTMSTDERRRVLDIVIDETAGRVPVVPHTGATSTAEAIRLTAHAKESGATAAMVVAPYYEPFSIAEIKRYYREISDATDFPLMAYNLPAATGVTLTPEIMGELIDEVPNVKYVKDTSGDFAAAAQLIHHFGDRVSVFVGWDPMFLGTLLEGASGSVIGAANVVPEPLVAVYEAVQREDLVEAKRIWQTLYPVLDVFASASNYNAAIKAGIELTGRGSKLQRSPGMDISAAELELLRQRLEALKAAEAVAAR